jgi:hypothetical protein
MTTLPRSLKITPTHLQRKAVVYIRQSTPKQVRTNTESQRNQRALVERAQALGWEGSRIMILDADLGQSASSTAGRDDFSTLTAEVALGHVGIIFGWEAGLVNAGKREKSERGGKPKRWQREGEEETDVA